MVLWIKGAVSAQPAGVCVPSLVAKWEVGNLYFCSDLECGIGGVHQYDAGDIRDATGARFYRARTAPEGGEGNHVVCV